MSFKARLILLGTIIFTVMPIVELGLLIEVGKRIGTFWTIGIVIGTGLLGGALLGVEGLAVLGKLKREIKEGRIPQDQIIDGVLVMIGALLLITPGLLTDITGMLLMFPPTRILVRALVKRWIGKYIVINI